MAIFIGTLLVFGTIYLILSFIRINTTFNYRSDVIEAIANNNRARINEIERLTKADVSPFAKAGRVREMFAEYDKKSAEAWRTFESVGFGTMCNRIWKPLNSFYSAEQLAKMEWKFDSPVIQTESLTIH